MEWPRDLFDRRDLEAYFWDGPGEHHNPDGDPFLVVLPTGWTPERARELWCEVAHEFDATCWAAEEWGTDA